MNKKQKICLLVGLAVLDLSWFHLIYEVINWRRATDFSGLALFGILVIINTGVVFVLLKDDKRP